MDLPTSSPKKWDLIKKDRELLTMSILKNFYKTYLEHTIFGRGMKNCLEIATAWRGHLARFSFPKNYLRRWKNDMLGNTYEPDVTGLFKKIVKPGMITVDIGAHIGYYTRLFSRLTGKHGRVLAFEADPENFLLLQKNTGRLANVSLHNVAVSEKIGQIDFYHSEDKTGCHSTIPADFRQKKLTVRATDLDSALQSAGDSRVDIIKMDIEGGEVLAIRGMQHILAANQEIALVTEFNPECLIQAKTQPVDFLKQINALGFKIFAITGSGLVPIRVTETSIYQNFLFGSHFVNIYDKEE